FVGARVRVRAQMIVTPTSLCSEVTIQVTPNALADSAPIRLDFEKSLAGPGPALYVATFKGSVNGDINGCLITRVIRREQIDIGKVEIEAEYEVYDGLTAHLASSRYS